MNMQKFEPQLSPTQKQFLDQQFNDLCLGAAEVLLEHELREKIADSILNNRPLIVKAGFDPTAPDLHLGHTILLRRLKRFQDYGHNVHFLIGDFTGMIGDPTGKSESRPPLTRAQVEQNAQTYKEQVFKILDPLKTKIVFNSSWLDKLSSVDLIKLAAQSTVARMLERDDFQKRYRDNRPISIHEFLYPLLQAYDSVVLKADVELGGTDQKFNLLMGRELQKQHDQTPQVVIMNPILEGTDGVQKMSKSLNNYIALSDSSRDMFGKIMRISDELMLRYYPLVSDYSANDVYKIQSDIRDGSLHPKAAKLQLAEHLVALYYGKDIGLAEKEEFDRVFAAKERPKDVECVAINLIDNITLQSLVVPRFVDSNAQFKRLIDQGAISLDGIKITDPKYSIVQSGDFSIRIGKKIFFDLIVKKT